MRWDMHGDGKNFLNKLNLLPTRKKSVIRKNLHTCRVPYMVGIGNHEYGKYSL
jgi:hypothetical protein